MSERVKIIQMNIDSKRIMMRSIVKILLLIFYFIQRRMIEINNNQVSQSEFLQGCA